MVLIAPPKLIAFNNGLSPYAQPLLCGDLVGPQSLLGESVPIPRPLRSIEKRDFSQKTSITSQMQSHAIILWEGIETNPTYAIPAHTFLTGKCTSTFDVAWFLDSHEILFPWSAVISTTQEAGRGQMRKSWHSPKGNLYVSFKLPQHPAFKHDAAAVIAGLLICSALRHYSYDIYLKWPNDLVSASGKKAGGILLEEKNGTLIVGLGINLDEIPPAHDLDNNNPLLPCVLSVTSTSETEDPPVPFFLWQLLVKRLILEYKERIEVANIPDILNSANEMLAWKEQRVNVFDEGLPTISGRCKGLSSKGGILIQTVTGSLIEVVSGSIRLA